METGLKARTKSPNSKVLRESGTWAKGSPRGNFAMAFRVLNVQREHTQALQDGIEHVTKFPFNPSASPFENQKACRSNGHHSAVELSAGEAPSLLGSSWTTTFLESAYHCSFNQFSANQKSLWSSFSIERVHATPCLRAKLLQRACYQNAR
jgi:hypothetical protein